MKFVFTFILIFQLTHSFSQNEDRSCRLISTVEQRLNQLHIKPIGIGEKEKKEIISIYITSIDEANLFYSIEEKERIQKEAVDFDLCAAYKYSIKIYEHSLKRYDSIVKKMLASPIHFVKGEKIVLNSSGEEHLRPSKMDFNHHIEKYIHFEILSRTYDRFANDSLLAKSYTPEIDVEIRKELLEDETQFIESQLNDIVATSKILLDAFLNSIALRYDPHSSFYSPDEKNDMDQQLSSEISIFGIQFNENKDFEIEILEVTPGSAAWNSNAIFKGDILVEIEIEKGKKQSLKNEGVNFLSKILSEPGIEEAIFYVRNKTGAIVKVELIKTKVENIENSFTGYVLSNPTTKIGYISLPSFYSDFESDFQLGCANDVAKEILLLKKDSIKGLVLDLRNNGGGSLKEAIELSGLFIDEGAMSVYQGKGEKPYLLKDMNRGTVYDGPLVVLVNSMSASASEFFAGCMQDYGRALIVGDRSFGKGTAQSVFPADSLNLSGSEGFVKITTGKFYHVSGRSNQGIGITPDVLMTDLFTEVDYFLESNEEFHLQNDSTKKKVIYVKTETTFSPEIIDKSKTRIASSEAFKKVNAKSIRLKKKVELDESIPLEFALFLTYSDEEVKFWDEIYKEEIFDSKMTIDNHSFAKKMFSYQENEKRFNDKIKEKMKNDLILYQSFLLFEDLINFAK